MTYLIGQIAFFLLLALILGLVVGWLLRGLATGRRRPRTANPGSEEGPEKPGQPPLWP